MLPHYWCILCKGFSQGWSLPAFLLWMKRGIPEPLCEISAHVNQTTPGGRFCSLRSMLNGSHVATSLWEKKCMCVHVCIGTLANMHNKTKWKKNSNGRSLIFLFLFKSQDQVVVWATLTQISSDIIINHRFTLMEELASDLGSRHQWLAQAWASQPRSLAVAHWYLPANLIMNSSKGELSIFQKAIPHTSE